MSKKYDLILFGVTGFTGRLAAEYLVEKKYLAKKWAVCARNPTKAKAVLKELGAIGVEVLQADNVCSDDKKKLATLRQVVEQTKVVATAVGPFEKYGKDLIRMCAECGVDYTDITGETDFVRSAISTLSTEAKKNQATIIPHCGNDCIPHDLVVFELNEKAKELGMKLKKVETFCDFPPSASVSGGTATTASFQLNKNRADAAKNDFDPLLTAEDGSKSEFGTKNISPKSTVYSETIQKKVAPWIMGPVMVNCVRRSNALLGYAPELQLGDSKICASSWGAWAQESLTKGKLAAGILVPALGSIVLPQPGQGPDRDTMEEGYFILTAIAELDGNDKKLKAVFEFKKDTGYLYTAALLMETCMVLLNAGNKMPVGVLTPAVACGHGLTERILNTMDATLVIEEI